MFEVNNNTETKDSQAKRLNSTVWTKGNRYMPAIMSALQAKRGDSSRLNLAGKDYDKFVWYHVAAGADFWVPLAHYRTVKPRVVSQLRRSGLPRDYIEDYLSFEGDCVLGEDLRATVETRFWDALNAATGCGAGS